MADDPENSASDRGAPEPMWWRPDWKSAFMAIGFGWLLLLGLLSILTIAPLLMILAADWRVLTVFFLKFALLCGGATVSLALYVIRRAVHLRKEPFCIFCGYNLSGLPDNYRCPECGRHYTLQMIDQYRSDPSWFIQRWRARQQLPPSDRPVDIPADAPRRPSRDGT